MNAAALWKLKEKEHFKENNFILLPELLFLELL